MSSGDFPELPFPWAGSKAERHRKSARQNSLRTLLTCPPAHLLWQFLSADHPHVIEEDDLVILSLKCLLHDEFISLLLSNGVPITDPKAEKWEKLLELEWESIPTRPNETT